MLCCINRRLGELDHYGICFVTLFNLMYMSKTILYQINSLSFYAVLALKNKSYIEVNQ